jgi:hypothetical protein
LDRDDLRQASLLVGIVGFGLVRDRFSFSDGWLIASIVLFVVASVLVLAAPMLRRATAGTATLPPPAHDRGEVALRPGDTARRPRARRDRRLASLCYVPSRSS